MALGVCSLAGLLAAIAFALVVPSLTDSLDSAGDEPALFILFVAGVVLMTLMAIQDAALAGVRRAGWLPVEQLIYNGLRVAALALAAIVGLDHGIMVAWVVPLVLVLPLTARILFRGALPAHATREREGETATPQFTRAVLARFLAADSVAFVMRQATSAVMPILVLAYVGPVEAAAFTVPFALVIAFDLLFFGAATSLTIEGAQHGARLGTLVRELIRRFLIPTLAISALLALAAPIALLPFGSDYASDGATALRYLALGSAVRALLVFIEVLQRLRGFLRPVLAFSAIALIGVAVIGPPLIDEHGIAGGGAAWFLAHALALVVVAPIGWRTLQDALKR
jgi:O-antigen/teichoic acid export membrane protein